MSKRLRSLAVLVCLVGLTGCATTGRHQQSAEMSDTPEQLFAGMGPHERAITTTSPQARRYFDQGLNWYYAFNHDEAIRSFKRAAQLDDNCAMAFWGVALSEGPNYNDYIMTDERSAAAWEALQQALARIEHTTPVERALIEALSQRYAKPWPKDRTALEKAYADAMAAVWAAYPNDSDVGTLYAEAMMVRNPWKLYTQAHEPAEDTPTIESVLQRAMAIDPDNPGAFHLYIHAVEASATPERGSAAAEHLVDMVPGSGHLLHMPSHIYVQVGEWNKAIVQNEKAMKADARYLALSPTQNIQYLYIVHNAHMLAFAAMMSGREHEALEAARTMWTIVPANVLEQAAPFVDPWMCAVYDVNKRFGRWEAIIAEPAPPAFLPITTAIWRADRAIAYAAMKDFERAEREQQAFRDAVAALPEDAMWFTDPARDVLAVSDCFVAGEIALQKGDLQRAAEELQKGVGLEDALTYSEPPQWTMPVRHTLGAVYLAGARYEDAERVYREDLTRWPNNGWSLYGLSRALQSQGKTAEAQSVEAQYRSAWKNADAPTTTSCKCIPKT